MFGSGILGLGHHYFWIGTPEYWQAFFEGQTQPWFVQAMQWRMAFGVVMTLGLLLFWDLLTIGRNESRPAKQVHAPEEERPAKA